MSNFWGAVQIYRIGHSGCHYKDLQAMFLCRMNFTVSIDGKNSQEKTAKNG